MVPALSGQCGDRPGISRPLSPRGFGEKAFTAALLHGLGLADLADLAYMITKGSEPEPPADPGCGPMGGMLLSAWNLPPRLARAVAAYEAPGRPARRRSGHFHPCRLRHQQSAGLRGSRRTRCPPPVSGGYGAGGAEPGPGRRPARDLGRTAVLGVDGTHGKPENIPAQGAGEAERFIKNCSKIGRYPMGNASGEALP